MSDTCVGGNAFSIREARRNYQRGLESLFTIMVNRRASQHTQNIDPWGIWATTPGIGCYLGHRLFQTGQLRTGQRPVISFLTLFYLSSCDEPVYSCFSHHSLFSLSGTNTVTELHSEPSNFSILIFDVNIPWSSWPLSAWLYILSRRHVTSW